MYHLIIGLIIIVSVLLILVILVQNSKGGGLASNFSSSNQVMGVRKTTDFLEKATWSLVITLLVLSLSASLTMPPREVGIDSKSAIDQQIQTAPDPTNVTSLPVETKTEKKQDTTK